MRTLPQRGPIPLTREVLERAGRHDAGTLAAALTYQGLLSSVPLLVLAGAAIGFAAAGDPAMADRWLAEIARIVPGTEAVVGRSLEALVDGRVQAGAIALAALVWTGSSLAGRAAHTMARVFELPERTWYRKRLRALAEFVILGTAGLVGIALTALTSAGAGPLPWLGAVVLDLALAVLTYRVLTPPGGPAVRGHLPGAVVLAAAWTLLKLGGGWYVGVVVARATAVYGTIAAIVGLLAILAIAANAFIYGAELSAVLARDD
ncbi:MAG: YhjD/YihY/BrkB family envelope integrity protein [Actinomycetota bacterium]